MPMPRARAAALFSTLALLLAACGDAARPAAPALILASGGVSAYELVCAAEASTAARAGAAELQALFRQVAGVELPIRTQATAGRQQIVIGRHPLAAAAGLVADSLDKDAFLIQADQGRIFLLGSDSGGGDLLRWSNFVESLPAGSYFAALEFARRFLGVEWYLPGPLGVAWRPLTQVEVPADLALRETPRFPRRAVEGTMISSRASQDRLVALGLCRRNYHVESVADECARWGRHLLLGNRSPVDFQHAHYQFVPADRPTTQSPQAYGASHPEYFALLAGRRDNSYRGNDHCGGQLCLSNPEVARTYAANVVAFGRKADTRSFSLSQNDGAGHCQCPECLAWDGRDPGTGEAVLSDRILRFANRVGAAVAAALPDARLGFYAYDATRHPPVAPLDIHPNVHVSDVYNYLPNFWHSGEVERARILRDLTTWRRQAKHVTLTSYYDIYGNWSLPWDTSDVLGAVMQVLAAHPSSDGVMLNNCRYFGLAPGVDGARLWVLARLLWNPGQPPEELQARFYRGAFGEVPGRHIADYFATINQAMIAVLRETPLQWEKERTAQQCLYPMRAYPPIRARCRELIDLAVAAAAPLDERTRWRVDQVARGWRFTELTIDAATAAAAARTGPFTPGGLDKAAAWQRAVAAGRARRAMVDDPANQYAISASTVDECTRQRPLGIVEELPEGATAELAVPAPADPACTLDGRLDEAVWQGLAPSREFLDNRGQGPAVAATWVKAFRSADALILGFHCAEPAMAGLRTVDAAARIWEGDVVEFFCSPSGADQEFCQFLVNPNGVGRAILMRGDKGEDPAWAPAWTWAAAREGGAWSVEMRIPFTALGLDPAKLAQTTPLVGFFRERYTDKPGLLAWIPTGGGFAQPLKFGRLRFAGR